MVYAIEINQDNFAPAKFTTIASLLNVILPTVILVVAILVLLYMLYGAFLWITGGDNAEQIKKAHNSITFAAIGFAIVVLSFIIVKVVSYILNIQSVVPL